MKEEVREEMFTSSGLIMIMMMTWCSCYAVRPNERQSLHQIGRVISIIVYYTEEQRHFVNVWLAGCFAPCPEKS
jgi:hypothetical protein